ncbi:hypothetical protein BU25DRAFT_413284 [Macroventuria anomochaeta]|uniref:Uncharacterized protein n=1 Tax=Macroventuria anomochaeta TaxID=301207 RepID=A0ACB6RSI2_9PLEO|nr:uncharacterized protein BU25DRAFT_413284 [Macroventuria anomochaeta]KAF2624739.1 hypothetical protein BU25DRAFT_413284 [Macroventuria anomochaeta]
MTKKYTYQRKHKAVTTVRPQTFRFLDLPLELRRFVYNFLPIRTKHTVIYGGMPENHLSEDKPATFTLNTKIISAQLLCTCRQINLEAKPYVERILAVIKEDIPRITMD